MKVSFAVILISAVYMMFLTSCAQPANPQGGPRDEEPPVIQTELSTPNEQVFFTKQDIKIVFDEFVNVDNPNTNVLISPPLDVNPKIYTRGKEVRVEFTEETALKEDATYVINFGDAIRDFNESNKLENYSFIFSTGAFIDSLTINGTIKDAYTGEPIEEVLVMLYDEFRDSIVYTDRPFYFAKSDKDGKFEIKNIRDDEFKLFVLKDENANYKYDLDTEKIGFLEEQIIVSEEKNGESYDIQLFLPKQEFELKEFNADDYGKVELIFTDDPARTAIKSSIEMLNDFAQFEEDNKVLYWYSTSVDTSFQLILGREDLKDTIAIRQRSKADFLEDNKFEMKGNSLTRGAKLIPETQLSFNFNAPIKQIDTSACLIVIDSVTTQPLDCSIDSLFPLRLIVDADFKKDSMVEIRLDSGKIVSIYDQVADDLTLSFSVAKEEDFGSINIKLANDLFVDSTFYILELMSGEDVYRRSILTGKQDSIISYDLIPPAEYFIRIIEDLNRNEAWDPGSYVEKRFSERLASKSLEPIREGWETEVSISADIFVNKPDPLEAVIDTLE
jgi:hypothetical protein